MPVTPLLAGYRLAIRYTAVLPHVQQLLVNANLVSGAYQLQAHDFSNVPTATFIAQYAAFMKTFFDTTATIDTWALQQFVGGAYVEVDSGTVGVAGTASGAPNPASQMTWVFIDDNRKRVKFRWLGANAVSEPAKNTFAVLGGRALAYVNDMLNASAGHVGYVVGGRSAAKLDRFIDEVEDYNRKTRRRLGLV